MGGVDMTSVVRSIPLDESYAHCHRIMKAEARNFYFGMRLLPEAKRRGMYALYSFMRVCDDLTDGSNSDRQDRRKILQSWREQMHASIDGSLMGHPIWPAFGDTVRRFGIPAKIFDDAIDGQLQDLDGTEYENFQQLYDYCYQVASTVGLAAIHIWGFSDSRALLSAERLGVAMQLTNIIRDIHEDLGRGRCYLPAEDLRRFDLKIDDFSAAETKISVEEFLHFQIDRARDFYEQSEMLPQWIHRDSRPTLRIMIEIYRGILDRLAGNPCRVMRERVKLSTSEKLWIVARNLWKAHAKAH